jgi:hypothetical protein
VPDDDVDLIGDDSALECHERDEPRMARVAMPRISAGMSIKEPTGSVAMATRRVRRSSFICWGKRRLCPCRTTNSYT